MNNVIFAIPGLMPPKAPHWQSEMIAPEDGSLCFLLHAGAVTDEVSYALDIRGIRPGVIKDPDYEFVGGTDSWQRELPHQALLPTFDRSSWPDFMRTSNELPLQILIPRKVCCGCPIPIDELPHLADLESVWYWILELPVRALPEGDTVIEVCVNGKLKKYTVQRPAFAIHEKSKLTTQYSDYAEIFTGEQVVASYDSDGKLSVEFAFKPVLDKYPMFNIHQAEFKLRLKNDPALESTAFTLTEDNTVVITAVDPNPSAFVGWNIDLRFNERETSWLPVAAGTTTI